MMALITPKGQLMEDDAVSKFILNCNSSVATKVCKDMQVGRKPR
jgi:hypothetical protein